MGHGGEAAPQRSRFKILDDFGVWHCPSLTVEQASRQFDSLKQVLRDLGVEAKAKKDIRHLESLAEKANAPLTSATLHSSTVSRLEVARVTGELQFCSRPHLPMESRRPCDPL